VAAKRVSPKEDLQAVTMRAIEQTKRGNAAWFSLLMPFPLMLGRTRVGVGTATGGAATGNERHRR